ncbi:hypothetical protein ELI02_02065 [Rhizobium leguminosarum]|uniref:hypothetical protein n=1 Tax=Rhizobium leguminosarum TaxID=384 RepID=UPI00102F6525|nr:hypothetical protein [Rhizobium leguminosarum]TAX58905.1 hypothetical protein ELI02_02065 [Rhizobium leguminosarum]
MKKKSRKSNAMIIDMIKADVHVELILWPVLQVKLEVGNDVGRYEINLFRMADPFRALSEICYQYHAELTARAVDGPGVALLKELEAITGSGSMYPVPELKAAGWSIPDFRRLKVAA